MRKPKLLLAVSILFCSLGASAQLGLRLPVNNAFRSDIQKVVEDYPHQFAHLRGGVLNENPQSVEYACRLKPAGVQAVKIVQYSSLGERPVYSWQAEVLRSEDFAEAVKKYKWLFQQLRGMNVKYVADQYTVVGQYAEPNESIGFAASTLALHYPPTPLARLRLEVTLNFEFPEWKVGLHIFEKERDDDEQPELVERTW